MSLEGQRALARLFGLEVDADALPADPAPTGLEWMGGVPFPATDTPPPDDDATPDFDGGAREPAPAPTNRRRTTTSWSGTYGPHATRGCTRDPAVAPCEKNSFGNGLDKRICALGDCSEVVEPRKRGGSPKRFCSERCQRIAERRRYRLRHWEAAVCKGCGREFERTTSSKRKQVYCTLKCMADSRSVEYAGRQRKAA